MTKYKVQKLIAKYFGFKLDSIVIIECKEDFQIVYFTVGLENGQEYVMYADYANGMAKIQPISPGNWKTQCIEV